MIGSSANLRDPDTYVRRHLKRWRWDPIAMVRELFRVEPDAWQAEALAAFPHVERLAFKACKGPGKTCCMAWLIWNFLLTRPFPHIGATSISADNIDHNLWPELAHWRAQSALLTQQFEITKTLVFLRGEELRWFCAKKTWPKSADPQQQATTLAGLHAPYTAFFLDESGSIPLPIMVTAEQVLGTGTECKVVQGGNPDSLEGPLYRACTVDKALWKVIDITGDPDDPRRSPRIKIEHARQEIARFGRDNPWVMVNILGQFPPSSLNALLGVEEVNAAMRRHLTEDRYTWAQKRLGVDVARFGDDMTVIFPRQGRAAFKPRMMRHKRTQAASVDIANAIIRAKLRWGSEQEFIDATGGWAAGARDVLLDAGYSIYEVQFAAPGIDPRYENRRAEMWFQMAQWVQDGGALPNLPELVGELTTPTYTFRKGKFLLEDKDQVKQRLGRSPNYADALATTFALPEMPAKLIEDRHSRGKAKRDADPFTLPVPGEDYDYEEARMRWAA